jgi:hypothetical protein
LQPSLSNDELDASPVIEGGVRDVQVRELREQLVKAQSKAALLQEQNKWADEQRKKAQAQLQVRTSHLVLCFR